jgi:VanZ family protein
VHTPALSPERKPLAVLCVIAVLALIYATLWPFNPFPPNGVSWLANANGIRFERSGVVFSNDALQAPPTHPAGDACAIEIYVLPEANDDSGNLLTFSSADNPDAIFLRQWRESLVVYRSISGPHGHTLVEFDANDSMRAGKLVLLTVSSGPHGIAVYVDGKIAAGAERFRIPRQELYRQIFMGNSPSNFQVWHGEVRGLAIYDQEVSPADAAKHYADWSSGSQSSESVSSDANHIVARYDFHERSGDVIHSEFGSAPPILIPAHFSVPRKAMLDSVVNEFDWSANYRKDVIQNILGFMPLGFVLCGFFALSRSRSHAVLISTFLGGLLSLTVESLQYYIPRRDSGWTDVITNTTGTLLGALIARPELVRGALRLVRLIPPKTDSESN